MQAHYVKLREHQTVPHTGIPGFAIAESVPVQANSELQIFDMDSSVRVKLPGQIKELQESSAILRQGIYTSEEGMRLCLVHHVLHAALANSRSKVHKYLLRRLEVYAGVGYALPCEQRMQNHFSSKNSILSFVIHCLSNCIVTHEAIVM